MYESAKGGGVNSLKNHIQRNGASVGMKTDLNDSNTESPSYNSFQDP